MASNSFLSSILHINTLYNSLLAKTSLYTAFFKDDSSRETASTGENGGHVGIISEFRYT